MKFLIIENKKLKDENINLYKKSKTQCRETNVKANREHE